MAGTLEADSSHFVMHLDDDIVLIACQKTPLLEFFRHSSIGGRQVAIPTIGVSVLPALSHVRRIRSMRADRQQASSRTFRRVLNIVTRLSVLVGLSLCGVTAAANAQVSYYIATRAASGNNSVAATAQYNWETLGGGAFTSQGPYGSQFLISGCASGCTAGTVSANPLLTSSYDQSSTGVNLDGWSATASANASLANGTIGASSTGIGELYGNQTGVGQATAFLQDSLTLYNNNPLATPSTVWEVGVNFTIDGTLSATAPAGDATVRATDYFGNAVIDTVVQNTYPNYTTAVQYFNQSGWTSVTLLSDSNPDDMSFSGEYTVTGLDPTIGIAMNLTADCGGGATCDYADTNGVTLTLPEDVTFTSQSGAFLTGAPEPGSLPILAMGLALFGLTRHRDLRSLFRMSPRRTRAV